MEEESPYWAQKESLAPPAVRGYYAGTTGVRVLSLSLGRDCLHPSSKTTQKRRQL